MKVSQALMLWLQWFSRSAVDVTAVNMVILFFKRSPAYPVTPRDHYHPLEIIWSSWSQSWLESSILLSLLLRSLPRHLSLVDVCGHLAVKCGGLVVAAPFQAASLVETVQSDIASESPGFLDVLREGCYRLTCWTCPQSGKGRKRVWNWIFAVHRAAICLLIWCYSFSYKGN